MALFTEPATYRAGAALRPVHGLDEVQRLVHGSHPRSAAGRHRSLPPFIADLFRGGVDRFAAKVPRMRDDNVFFQDTVRLTERLIELGKNRPFRDRDLPVRAAQLHRARVLDGRIQADLRPVRANNRGRD
jgi:hypothetical protein